MKLLEHNTGDISGTFPAHRIDGTHSAGTYDTYTWVTFHAHFLTFPVHFLDVAYTSKIYHVYNIKYTQIEANIPTLYNVYKVYKQSIF